MSRIIRPALAALFLLALCGCASLLERSYSVVEPYTVRYWDSSGPDTLRAENYQDLVNSLMLLVEERAEEGVIRCYGEAEPYAQARSACREVQNDTMLGSYLLSELRFTYSSGAGCSTLTLEIAYRDDAEDPESIMTLSDSQSLVDLLRIDVREGHERLTARFVYDTSREEVSAAMEALWQELCQDSQEPEESDEASGEPEAALLEDEDIEGASEAPEDTEAPQDAPEEPPEEGGDPEEPRPEDGDAVPAAVEDPVVCPPCPWTARYYPDQDTAGIVEILLDPAGTARALEEAHSGP